MARYFTIINLGLIALITYLGTFVFYRVLTERLETAPVFHTTAEKQTVPKENTEAKQPAASRMYQAVVERNLFKATPPVKPTPKKEEQVNVKALKQTRLGLKLWGTVSGTAGKAFAVIEEKSSRKQRLFTVGDEVQSASIEMILREKVVLGVSGKKEVLRIEKLAKKRRSPGTRGVTTIPPATSKAPASEDPGAMEDKREVVIQRSRIEEAIQNVNQLMKYVRIRPHFTEGQPDGLRLTGVRPGTIFTDIGFRNGDIITGVNGREIQSVDDALKFYSSLKNESNVDLQIRRGGRVKTIQYRVED